MIQLTSSDLIALLAAFGVPYCSLMAWIILKLGRHDTALALLVQQVNPPGDKSLREMLKDIQLEQARSSTTTTNIGNQ